MAQATILAAGTTAATSTDVTVAAGASVTIGIFTSDSAGIPGNHYVQVWQDTPGTGDILAGELTGNKPQLVISGPGTFRAKRPLSTTSIGIFTES